MLKTEIEAALREVCGRASGDSVAVPIEWLRILLDVKTAKDEPLDVAQSSVAGSEVVEPEVVEPEVVATEVVATEVVAPARKRQGR